MATLNVTIKFNDLHSQVPNPQVFQIALDDRCIEQYVNPDGSTGLRAIVSAEAPGFEPTGEAEFRMATPVEAKYDVWVWQAEAWTLADEAVLHDDVDDRFNVHLADGYFYDEIRVVDAGQPL